MAEARDTEKRNPSQFQGVRSLLADGACSKGHKHNALVRPSMGKHAAPKFIHDVSSGELRGLKCRKCYDGKQCNAIVRATPQSRSQLGIGETVMKVKHDWPAHADARTEAQKLYSDVKTRLEGRGSVAPRSTVNVGVAGVAGSGGALVVDLTQDDG